MNKMLKTKIAESISNKELPVLGAIKIDVDSSKGSYNFIDIIPFTVVLKDDNVDVDVANKRISFNDGSTGSVWFEKYGITAISILTGIAKAATLNIDELKYSDALIKIGDLNDYNINCTVKGDLSSMSGKDLRCFVGYCVNDEEESHLLTGDISVFSEMTNLKRIALRSEAKVTGDISSLNSCTNLETLQIYGRSGTTGNIETLSTCTHLKTLNVYGTSYTGSIDNLFDSWLAAGKGKGDYKTCQVELGPSTRIETSDATKLLKKEYKYYTVTFTESSWTVSE